MSALKDKQALVVLGKQEREIESVYILKLNDKQSEELFNYLLMMQKVNHISCWSQFNPFALRKANCIQLWPS